MSGRPRPRPATVYAVADVAALGVDAVPAALAAMADAGIGTVQLRAKRLADDALARLVDVAFARLAGWDGQLWIDDRVDLAALAPFAGVHLGQRDLAPGDARRVLAGRPTAIGWSTHDAGQLAAGDADPDVDWLALGPIFPTAGKDDPDPVVGLARLAELRQRTAKPLVAIGGIDAGNLAAVLAAGADSVAVLSAVCRGDVGANCRRLLRAAAERP